MRLKRSLGQVFLRERKYIQKIMECVNVKGRNVLEIGPGDGLFTDLLSQKAKQVYCVELDKRFFTYLKQKFSQRKNVNVINCDILDFSLSTTGSKLVVFGNVPYHISSQLIEYFIAQRRFISKVYLTFQKEFVDKLIAKVGTSEYSFISCYIQFYARVKKNFDIPAKAFYPSPKIKSSFIELSFCPEKPYQIDNEKFFFAVIRKAFSNRRKKIGKALFLKGCEPDFFISLRIDPNLRPVNLSLREYAGIANKLYLLGQRI